MVKLKGPLLSQEAAGKFGDGIAFRRSKDGPIVERNPVPKYRRTSGQNAQRELYSAGVGVWHGLSSDVKEYYESIGKKVNLTGYSRFMQDYLNGHYVPVIYPDFDSYSILPSPETNNKHAFMVNGQRYIFEYNRDNYPTSPTGYIHIYTADEDWEKVSEISVSPFATGDCYHNVNTYNMEYSVIEEVVPGKLVWVGSQYNGGWGYIGTYTPATDEWEVGLNPGVISWQWYNFLLYNENDGYFYFTGWPQKNYIMRCLRGDLTNPDNWQVDELPNFPYYFQTYPAINILDGEMYIYRQNSLINLCYDIVKGTWGSWEIIKTNNDTTTKPYSAWWAQLATDGEYLYGSFLSKPGSDYIWTLKKSNNGIEWDSIIEETVNPKYPPYAPAHTEPCSFCLVVRKNPTYVAMCNVNTNGTLNIYNVDGEVVIGGITYGCTLGYFIDNGLGVFSSQFSQPYSDDPPYCANMVVIT